MIWTPSEKWCHLGNDSAVAYKKVHLLCTLHYTMCTLYYVLYVCSTVGWSIASMYDLSLVCIFISVLHTSVNMAPWVIYIGYGPPYRTTYIIYYTSRTVTYSV